MRLRSRRFVALLAISTSVVCVRADEAKQPNYLLFPIKTDLQRELLSSPADAYMQFDVEECLQDRKFDVKRFDRDGIRQALAALARQIGKAKPRLFIGYRYANGLLDAKQSEALEKTVQATYREAGFVPGGTNMLGEGGSWADKIAPFSALTDEANAIESPLEDEFVHVYPVRTTLSRFVLGKPDCDCFMVLRQPIDRNFKDFSLEVRLAMNQLLTKLALAQRDKLIMSVMTTSAGQVTAQRYFQRGGAKWESAADRLAKKLGFRSTGYLMCPMNVSPEDLLGKQVPDFTLAAFAGGQIHLHEIIRGRVAVIAFWGVACGACCDEAPHLTALYDRYKDNGLAVVAVNGYDESRPQVDRFVRAKHLTHPIALMGGKVAQEFTVASYPVTWLVDHNGTVADYHLGFDRGDEALLAKSVTRLLAEREKAAAGR